MRIAHSYRPPSDGRDRSPCLRLRSHRRLPHGLGLLIIAQALWLCGCGLFELGQPRLSSHDPALKVPAIKQAAANHDVSAIPQLISGLNSTDPAIRFYCAYGLKQITGHRFGYRYYAAEPARQISIDRWRQWEKSHGLVKGGA